MITNDFRSYLSINKFEKTETHKLPVYPSTQLSASLASRPSPLEINPAPSRRQSLTLPTLSSEEQFDLYNGKRIQRQHRFGRQGHGLVVVDVPASIDEVFDTLVKFHKYEEMISTVKAARIYYANETCNAAEFCLSRFHLKVNVVHFINKQEKSIRFTLDKNRFNPALKYVEGHWNLEEVSGREGDATRVWLNIELEASRLVPPFIVDYAAGRALPKATLWLAPYFAQTK